MDCCTFKKAEVDRFVLASGESNVEERFARLAVYWLQQSNVSTLPLANKKLITLYRNLNAYQLNTQRSLLARLRGMP